MYVHTSYRIYVRILFKGPTRGDPWAPSLMKQNLNRTQKYKVITFKKIKKTFKDVTRRGPWWPHS